MEVRSPRCARESFRGWACFRRVMTKVDHGTWRAALLLDIAHVGVFVIERSVGLCSDPNLDQHCFVLEQRVEANPCSSV